jgi:hypothetical protein
MSKIYALAESVTTIAQRILSTYHPELATARIQYLFVEKASMKNGRPVLGKVRKVSGAIEFLTELDFLIEVALDQWNELAENQRTALVDHLLERCMGTEDENDGGEMKWSLREPDVQEFTSILSRYGAWTDELAGLVSVAQKIDVSARVQDVIDTDTASEMTAQV